MKRQSIGPAPQPHDGRYFLLFHLLAWLIYGGVYYEEVVRYQRPDDYWQVVLAATLAGSLVCWPMALVNAQTRQRELAVRVVVAVLTTILAAIVWSAIRGIHFAYVYSPGESVGPSLSGGALFRATNTLLFWNALYLAYDHYKMAKHHEIQVLTAQTLARDSQLKLLSYQLNPHFLFNVLNSVATLVLKEDRSAAHATVVKLSNFLRYTLESEPWRKVSLDRELRCIAQYLEIQKVRFQEKLKISYDVPDDLTPALVPNLILQPIVENAIKHTIAAAMSEVAINIKGRRDNDDVTVQIVNSLEEDCPTATEQDLSVGHGLANVRQRLAAYYGDSAELTTSNSSRQYSVTLRLPYETPEGLP